MEHWDSGRIALNRFLVALNDAGRAKGVDVWPQVSPRPLTFQMTMEELLVKPELLEVLGELVSDEAQLLDLIQTLPYVTGRSLDAPGSAAATAFPAPLMIRVGRVAPCAGVIRSQSFWVA